MSGKALTSAARAALRKTDPWRAFEKLPLAYSKTAPEAKTAVTEVPFGAVKGEDRGDPKHIMSPPITREDPYFWMRDDKRKNEAVLSHLRAENAYANECMRGLEQARVRVYREILSHVQETDTTCPYSWGGWEYYTRTIEGSSYSIHCRRRRGEGTQAEEVVLDENKLAEGLSHFEIGDYDMDSSHTHVAYSVDTRGYETYTIRFRDLPSGSEDAKQELSETDGSVCFVADDTVVYATMDESHRSNRVWAHKIGNPQTDATLLFEEKDRIFSTGFRKTSCGRYLVIRTRSSETSEEWLVDLAAGSPWNKICVAPREEGIMYRVDTHSNGAVYIATNRDGAKNFKLAQCAVNNLGDASRWTDVFSYDADIKVDGAQCFEKFIAVEGRRGGFSQIWLFDPTQPKQTRRELKFDESAHTVWLGPNKEFKSDTVRIKYTSLTSPKRDYECAPGSSDTLTLLKEDEVPSYQPNLYASERRVATAADGTQIPMSLVYRKDKVDLKTPTPVHLYGYGSYEISIDPTFRTDRLPLLDRGVVYAIAHVRGGGEMGRTWYEAAKYADKTLTFSDFISCAQSLVDEKVTTAEMLSMEGRSAGGLLVGAVLNMAPGLFKAAVAGVPFVDVLNTMSDPKIPLTTGEWVEWGNPNIAQDLKNMAVYSPYDNVKPQAYPAVYVSSGLFDPRVAYWEPAKWVSKLRKASTSGAIIVSKCDLESGHFSASDRYRYYWERSIELCFILEQIGCLSQPDKASVAAADAKGADAKQDASA